MCGIVGIIHLNNQTPIKEDLFVSMCDEMSHRGPDGDGFHFSGKINQEKITQLKSERPSSKITSKESDHTIFLGHRRLSIIDLNPLAAQPMSTADQKIWIVFNGEIYNHAELRKELVAKGHQFITDHSDTECIINAYKEWGIDCIHRFRGMFAFCLWDEEKETAWLIRDRIGIKPLYYTIHDGKLYFASEIKAFLKDKTIPRGINEEGLYNYLSFLTVPAPQTLFKDIYKLPAGHRIKIHKGKVSETEQYWDVFDNVKMMKDKPEKEITSELIDKLRESVKYRLESDVPVGVFLSGGIDSSTNAALFSEIAKEPVRAFSIGYANDEKLESYKNEFVYSRRVAKDLACDYHELELTQKDLIDFLPRLIHLQDEPIADPVCVPLYFLSKLARDNGVTVCQVGEGSDELFWGYETWKRALKLQEADDIPIPNFLKKAGLLLMKALRKDGSQYYEYLRRGSLDIPVFWGGAEAFSEAQKSKLLSKSFKQKFKNYTSWEILKPYYKKYKESAPEQSHLNWMTYLDLKLRLPELLLMRVDKMSMGVSLEGRVPFLDHVFVEYAMSIPAKVKTKNDESKHILKEAVKGIIPDEIIYRKKQGFGAPIYEWFLDELGPIAKEKIKKFNDATQVFSDDYLQQLYERKEGHLVWYLLNLAMWWEKYIIG